MADHHSHDPQGPTESELQESIAAGYEQNDVSLSLLVKWGLGLGVFLIISAAMMLIVFALLQRPPFAPPSAIRSLVRSEPLQPPPGTPILQDNPAGDPRPDNNPRRGIDNIREFRRDEEIRLNEYATQDGKIHIPIDRAMEIVSKDFPAQQPGEAPTGVPPTPEMKLHPDTRSAAPGGSSVTTPSDQTRPPAE